MVLLALDWAVQCESHPSSLSARPMSPQRLSGLGGTSFLCAVVSKWFLEGWLPMAPFVLCLAVFAIACSLGLTHLHIRFRSHRTWHLKEIARGASAPCTPASWTVESLVSNQRVSVHGSFSFDILQSVVLKSKHVLKPRFDLGGHLNHIGSAGGLHA